MGQNGRVPDSTTSLAPAPAPHADLTWGQTWPSLQVFTELALEHRRVIPVVRRLSVRAPHEPISLRISLHVVLSGRQQTQTDLQTDTSRDQAADQSAPDVVRAAADAD